MQGGGGSGSGSKRGMNGNANSEVNTHRRHTDRERATACRLCCILLDRPRTAAAAKGYCTGVRCSQSKPKHDLAFGIATLAVLAEPATRRCKVKLGAARPTLFDVTRRDDLAKRKTRRRLTTRRTHSWICWRAPLSLLYCSVLPKRGDAKKNRKASFAAEKEHGQTRNRRRSMMARARMSRRKRTYILYSTHTRTLSRWRGARCVRGAKQDAEKLMPFFKLSYKTRRKKEVTARGLRRCCHPFQSLQ